MLLIVPLAGLLATGSWRSAWRYTKDWGRACGVLVLVACIVYLTLPS